MCPCTLAHRMLPTLTEIRLSSIDCRSWCVVHRSGNHSGKRKHEIVLRRDVIRAFVVLHSIHALICHSVRIFALETGRLECTVVIDKKMALKALTSHILIEVHHILVIHLHKVDLDTLHSPITISIEDVLHILHHRSPQSPKNNSDSLGIRISDDLSKIKLRIRLHDIESACRPALIHKDILKAILRSEIHIVLICICIDASLKVNAIYVEHCPPFPRNLAWLKPVDIIAVLL